MAQVEHSSVELRLFTLFSGSSRGQSYADVHNKEHTFPLLAKYLSAVFAAAISNELFISDAFFRSE
jgi:hypothetical protein